jgi:phage-related minor tail protein
MSELTDNEALFLQFSADNTKMLRSFETAAAKVGAYADQIERRTRKMAEKVESAGVMAGEGFNKGLNRGQLMELGHSVRASFDAIAAGASPLRVLAMEAPRVAQALGSGTGGLGGTLGALAGYVSPVVLTLGALGAALAAGAISAVQYVGQVHEIETALAGLGRASGATIGQIQAIAEAQAAGGAITEGAVKKIETAMVTAGRVTSANLGEATTVVREFAKATHEKMAEASKDMAKAFADPAKGAHDLGVEYGLLGEKQVEEIRRLQEHEGRAAALKKLLEDLETELKRSGGALADHADGWAAVATAIGHAWENLGKFIALRAGLASPNEQLQSLQNLRDQYASSGDASLIAQLPDLDAQMAPLRAQVAAAAKMAQDTAKRAQKNQDDIERADKAKKGPADQTAAFDKAAMDALNAGNQAVAKAQAALIDGIQAHAQAEKTAVDARLKSKLDDLEAEAQRIGKAKNDADKLAQRAKINSAKAAEQEAAEIEKRLIDQKAATAALEQFLGYSQRIHSDYARIAENSAAMADTAAQRNKIERDQLLAEQRNELFAFDQQAKDELSKLSGPDLDRRRSDLDAERNAKVDRNNSDLARQAYDSAGPLDQYLRKIGDLNTAFEQDGVTFVQDMTSGLVNLAAQGKLTAQSLENIFLNLLVKMLAQSAEEAAAPALAGAVKTGLSFLGLASGGQVRGPGSTTSDSIPTMLSDKEFVVKASATRRYLPLLEAINSDRPLHRAMGGLVGGPVHVLNSMQGMDTHRAGGVTVIQPFHFHAEGAVLTPELLAQANRDAAQIAAQAGRAARAAAVSDVQRGTYMGNENR